MVARKKAGTALTEKPDNTKGLYTPSETHTNVSFLPSGCDLLDLVLGSGYGLGRITNIVGDKSSGKTLLAIEACANFDVLYGNEGKIWYNESEAAFDESYAEGLGLPVDAVTFSCSDNEPKEVFVEDANSTVEGLFEHLTKVVEYHKKHGIKQGLYIVDSLDAFSDRAESERDIDAGSYNTAKAKKMGELFRRLVRKLEHAQISVIIVSQVRDKIGVTFGPTKTRSGGHALDFYASQIMWLAEIGKNEKTVDGIKRPVSVNVRCKCTKNKLGQPFRDADYVLEFGYGVDNITSNIDFLIKVGDTEFLEELGIKKSSKNVNVKRIKAMDDDEFEHTAELLANRVTKRWNAIEDKLKPARKKYAKKSAPRGSNHAETESSASS